MDNLGRRAWPLVATLMVAVGLSSCLPIPSHPTTAVVAYVPSWDQDVGFATALDNADVLTDVSPWWYTLGTDGSVALQWDGAGTRTSTPSAASSRPGSG